MKTNKKVRLCMNHENMVSFMLEIANVEIHSNTYFSSEPALRGARKFCNAIGYEMEVMK